MQNTSTSTKQDIYYERLLVESKIKECEHIHMVEDYCMDCKKVVR